MLWNIASWGANSQGGSCDMHASSPASIVGLQSGGKHVVGNGYMRCFQPGDRAGRHTCIAPCFNRT
eukprot:scaffold264947_cov20-Tisochrysis_lutea.AAC.1